MAPLSTDMAPHPPVDSVHSRCACAHLFSVLLLASHHLVPAAGRGTAACTNSTRSVPDGACAGAPLAVKLAQMSDGQSWNAMGAPSLSMSEGAEP